MNDYSSLKELLESRSTENHQLHEKYVNPQMRKVLKTIGFAKHYVRGEGSYLYDKEGNRYLDLLAGYGVFNMGRNHPLIKQRLKEAVDLDLPSLVQMDDHLLSGLLAEKLINLAPASLERVFFTNSGTEAVETAIKLTRGASGKEAIVYCNHSFHGLSMGSLSLNGGENFRHGFGQLLPNCRKIAFNNLTALETELQKKDVAAFIVEPVQGKGVNLPAANFLKEAKKLCQQYGSYLVVDEIQAGLGRLGSIFASKLFAVEPDMLLIAKSLSGGMVPVGAALMTKEIYQKVFSSMDRCVIHSSTFAQGSLAMICGLASLEVIEKEKLAAKAKENGRYLLEKLKEKLNDFEMIKEVRGLGMMIAIEFKKPKSLKLKVGWELIHKASGGLFPQLIIIPLMEKYRILTQVAGHNMDVIKILPPLNISREDCDYFIQSMTEAVKEAHRFPGATWSLAKNLVSNIMRK